MKIEELQSYELLEKKPLPDVNGTGYRLRHKKSGARIAVVSNEDENKVFYVGFRTPPADSTGVAHIVEHTVLCGSEKFPAKDPFVELVKGSLNTFLNAMTYPDKTVYPVASCNDTDFQNLMDVYMDAVLHPNIYKRKEIFKQEGWHYELEDVDAPLTHNGVVYNEMKGAFSSPEGVLDREILNSLFPDTTYANESGGDPACIPDLTYEAYLDFHRRYYHPCNSYIYLYGDMDVCEKLNWLDQAYLQAYEAIDIDSAVAMQKPFTKPREIRRKYSIASGESLTGNTYLSYNMAIGKTTDPKLYHAFEILDYALLSAPGAPLKKALIDAGIGKDILGSFDNGTLQPIFSIVAKNADAKDMDRFTEIIRQVLKEQADGALNKKALLAGINSSEFKYRESDFGSYPKGLIYGLQMLDSWLYDDTLPFMHLEAQGIYRFLREQVDTDYFENLIRTGMLENTHVSRVMIEPEHGLNAKNEAALAEKLEQYKQSLSQEEKEKLVEDTRHLKAYQSEPTPVEDLEKIPMLTRADMKKEAPSVALEDYMFSGSKVLYYDTFSNGIVYFGMLFDTKSIPQEKIPLLGILKAVLGYMDTEHYTYDDLANEINLNTGGFSAGVTTYTNADDASYQAKFEVRIKALYDQIPQAEKLLEEILFTTRFEDTGRLKEILAEVRSRLQMSLSSAGNSVSAVRAMSAFSETAKYSDLTSGIGFYQTVAAYEEQFEEKKEQLVAELKDLAARIFTVSGLTYTITCDKEGKALAENSIRKLTEKLPAGQAPTQEEPVSCTSGNEAFFDASKVQYVSRAGNFRQAGFSYHGALKILKVILNYDYLWNNIRVLGGAYGCGSGFLRNGNAYVSSYRDPNLEKTNEIYDGMTDYIRNFDASERDMTKYIIGTVSELDTPLMPAGKGLRAVSAYLGNITDEDIQRERDQVIQAEPQDIRNLAPLVRAVMEQNHLCVIGNEEKITEQKDMFDTIRPLF